MSSLAAEAVHKERSGPSSFDTDYAETLARNKARRERAVSNLMARSNKELIDLARSNSSLPSVLETALANKLELALQRLEEFSN